MGDTLYELEDVGVRFPARRGDVAALHGIDLCIERGDLLLVRGPSGSGKTTLLLTLGGMLRPTEGHVRFEGVDLYGRTAAELRAFRARRVGFAFQTMHLLPYLDLAHNVALGAGDLGLDRARALLDGFGLAERADHRPGALSAGERQRAALARAIIGRPDVLLADEPTGNLDPENGERVLAHLADFHRDGGTVVLVSHENELALQPTRELALEAGALVDLAVP